MRLGIAVLQNPDPERDREMICCQSSLPGSHAVIHLALETLIEAYEHDRAGVLARVQAVVSRLKEPIDVPVALLAAAPENPVFEWDDDEERISRIAGSAATTKPLFHRIYFAFGPNLGPWMVS